MYIKTLKMKTQFIRKCFKAFIIILSFNILLANSIIIPLSTNQTRCMLIYTSSNEDTIKLDINLPQLQNAIQNQDYYLISKHNTELKQIDYQIVKKGNYRKQLKLTPQIIYQICMKIISDKPYKVQVNYQDHHLFKMSQINQKIPESLLKKQDLESVYRDVLLLEDISAKQIKMYQQRKESENFTFSQIQQTNYILFLIQSISIIFLVLMGAIQFHIIKQHLVDTMYI